MSFEDVAELESAGTCVYDVRRGGSRHVEDVGRICLKRTANPVVGRTAAVAWRRDIIPELRRPDSSTFGRVLFPEIVGGNHGR